MSGGISKMAAHSRRNDAMLYDEQTRGAITITSGWIAGLPKSGQQHFSNGDLDWRSPVARWTGLAYRRMR